MKLNTKIANTDRKVVSDPSLLCMFDHLCSVDSFLWLLYTVVSNTPSVLCIHHQPSVPGIPKMMSDLNPLFHSDLHPVILFLVSYFFHFFHFVAVLQLILITLQNLFIYYFSLSHAIRIKLWGTIFVPYSHCYFFYPVVFYSYSPSECKISASILSWQEHMILSTWMELWVPAILMQLHRYSILMFLLVC